MASVHCERAGFSGRAAARRRPSDGFRDQIVIGVADDLHLGKVAKRQFATNVNASINVRRISFAAGHQIALGVESQVLRLLLTDRPCSQENTLARVNSLALAFASTRTRESAPDERGGIRARSCAARHGLGAPLFFKRSGIWPAMPPARVPSSFE